MPDAALDETLSMLAAVMADARDDHWVIGSAAVRMHGVDTSVGDVDVLLSERDAETVFGRLGLPPMSGIPDDRFRSRRFGRWQAPPLAVEFMAGLEVCGPAGWSQVRTAGWVRSRSGRLCPIPDPMTLIGILQLFGRAKDLERAARLAACASASPGY